jgi:hypothetical protein
MAHSQFPDNIDHIKFFRDLFFALFQNILPPFEAFEKIKAMSEWPAKEREIWIQHNLKWIDINSAKV